MQAIGPAAALHGTAGMFINDDHFAVFHDVVYVAGEEHVCTQRSGDVVHQHDVARGVERLALVHDALFHQQLFNQHQPALGQVHLTRFLIHGEVAFALEGVRVLFLLTDQVRDDFVDALVHVGAVFRRTGDDQRRTGFVDQDGVHLIHQRIVQLTLNALFRTERHIVTQIVKAVFVVGAVGDICGIGLTLGRCRQARHVNAHAHAKELEQRTVVFGVTLGQVVVDGDYVHAFTAQGVQVGRQGCGQGFTFTGTHLGDAAIVKHHAAQQLDIKVAHTEYALARFAHHGECFRDQALYGLAFFKTGAELGGFSFQLVIAELLHSRFHAVDKGHGLAHPAQGTIVTATKYFC